MTGTGTDEDPIHTGKLAKGLLKVSAFWWFFWTGANAVSDVERTLKSLNGYHEDILEALRNAASSHRSSGNTPSGSISEEILRKTLQECAAGNLGYEGFKRSSSKNSSRENICDNNPQMNAMMGDGTGTMLHHHRSQQQLHQPSLQQQQVKVNWNFVKLVYN
jgi:hypothetical protein